MNVLSLIIKQDTLSFALFNEKGKSLFETKEIVGIRGRREIKDALGLVQKKCEIACCGESLFAVLRSPFGGETFDGPVLCDDRALADLEAMIGDSPIHLPLIIETAKAFKNVFAPFSLIFVFETAFFIDLPKMEKTYAIKSELTETYHIRKYGYHGLFHHSALHWIRKKQTKRPIGKLISICLDRRPELVAIKDGVPLMVTSGLTPMEGLPGESSCGEIDPGIVIALSKKRGWGPEKINTLLTSQSGLSGLSGEWITFDTLFTDKRYREARKVFEYRLLLECGKGIAAMNGLDAIVFSGKYACFGNEIMGFLLGKIKCPGLDWRIEGFCYHSTLHQTISTIGVSYYNCIDKIVAHESPAPRPEDTESAASDWRELMVHF